VDKVVAGGTNRDGDERGENPIWRRRRHQAKGETIGRGGRMERTGEGGRCDGSWWGSEARTMWRGDGYKRGGIFGYIMIVRGGVKSGDGWKEMTALRAAVPSYHTTHTQIQEGYPAPSSQTRTPRQFKFLSTAQIFIPIHIRSLGLPDTPFLFSSHEVPKTLPLSIHGDRNAACHSPFLHIQYNSPAFSPSSLFRPSKFPWFSSYLFRRS
jgi:hypothetical protein